MKFKSSKKDSISIIKRPSSSLLTKWLKEEREESKKCKLMLKKEKLKSHIKILIDLIDYVLFLLFNYTFKKVIGPRVV